MLLSIWNSIFDLVTVLFILAAVLVLTYFTTRFVAGYQKGKSAGRNIEVIETYKIATGKYIQIVRTGEKYLAIAIGKDEIHVLTELTSEELKFPTVKEVGGMPKFKDFLDKAKHMKDKNQDEK